MSHLSLALLGPPEARHGGQVVKFRTRKALALLVYMAVEGSMHARERITDLFWPESDESQGRGMLRTTIAYLRDALDDTALPPHLLIRRDSLGFDFTSDFDLDLQALKMAWAFARSTPPSSSGNPLAGEGRRDLLAQLSHAVALYRGDFLEGFLLDDAPDFEDWTRLQREVWHQRMRTVFDRLTQVQLDGGELADAIETTTRWVAHEPLNELAHRRLMQLYFTAGDHIAALRAYETCRAVLVEQLGAKPSPETRTLAERIRSAGGTTSAKQRGTNQRTSSASYGAPARPVLFDVPLVGRASEYSKLIELYHQASDGLLQVAVLKGEAGIGKTRLADEFLGWATAQGADIIRGRAFEMGGHLPYQSLVACLRSRIERENAPDDLLSDPWLAELSRILPELQERYPDLPPPKVDETTAGIRLFEAITRLLQALTERAPVVLFIDDAHWADAASLDVIHYAGQRWTESGAPLLVLLAVRAEALVTPNALTRWLSGLKHSMQVTHLTLSSLTRDDTIHLVSMLGKGGDGEATANVALEQMGQWLFHETNGQPFFLMETLNMLLERDLLITRLQPDGRNVLDFTGVLALRQTGRQALIPASVRDMIRARLESLSTAGMTLSIAGAVLGQGFAFELLYRVAALTESDALAALDEVLMSGLFTEEARQSATNTRRSAGAGRVYFFTHDKIRDVIYTEFGEARRRIFHRRALEMLQAEQRSSAELVEHALAAELAEQSFSLSLAAGNEAMRVFAVRTAISHYEQGRQLLAEQWNISHLPASISITTVEQLYAQLGRAYELVSEAEIAQTVYETMLALAQESQTPTMECAALNRLATLAAQNFTPEGLQRSTSLLYQALQVAEQYNDMPGLAETEWNLAQSGVGGLNPHLTLTHGERALSLARQLDASELIARCLNSLTYGNMMVGRWNEAISLAEEAKTLFKALGNRPMEADCLAQIATSSLNRGLLQACIDAARKAYAMSIEIENPWGQANSIAPLICGLLDSGAYTEALQLAQEGLALVNKHGLLILYFPIAFTMGWILRAMQAVETACETHLGVWPIVEEIGKPALIESLSSELCADYAVIGNWEEAHRYALKALESRTDFFIMWSKRTLWYETEALVRAGEIERTIQDVQQYGAVVGTVRRYRIPYLRALAVLAQYRGELGQASEHLREATTLAEEIGLPGELWSIQAALGDLYHMQGETEQAQTAFEQAAAMVRKLADTIGSDEQRANFLASPLVQRVLDN